MSDIQQPGLTATRRVDSDAMGAAIKDIFRTAHSEGRSTLFEHEVYRLLNAAGIASTPRHELLTGGAEPADERFASATLTGVTVAPGAVTLRVTVATRAGTARKVILPLPYTP